MCFRSTITTGALAAALVFPMSGTALAQQDLDCVDFATQADAQAEFDADPSDPNGLDADNDSLACEDLPGGDGTSVGGTPAPATQSPNTENDDNPAPSTGDGDNQVEQQPSGAVEAGDGSTSDPAELGFVAGGLALTAAAGAAYAARRTARNRT